MIARTSDGPRRIFLAFPASDASQINVHGMESSSTSDLAELVRRAQRGDESAQRELILAYQHRVAGFVYAMTNRSDYVEDLAQQVFIKMVRAIDRLQAPAQFESWLFRLARNTCIDQLRRQKLRRIFLPRTSGLILPMVRPLTPDRFRKHLL